MYCLQLWDIVLLLFWRTIGYSGFSQLCGLFVWIKLLARITGWSSEILHFDGFEYTNPVVLPWIRYGKFEPDYLLEVTQNRFQLLFDVQTIDGFNIEPHKCLTRVSNKHTMNNEPCTICYFEQHVAFMFWISSRIIKYLRATHVMEFSIAYHLMELLPKWWNIYWILPFILSNWP